MPRRHDIDALRALAFALVILYHVGMYYVAGWHWHLKSPHAAEWLQLPMRALNLWRMDLVFLVSGVSVGFLLRKAAPRAMLRQRSWRLLLPLAFGMLVIVPYQPYAQMVANGSTAPGFGDFLGRYFTGGPWPAGAFDGSDFGITWNHLWFLPYLWLYTAALALLLPLLRSASGEAVRQSFLALKGPRLLVLPALPLVAWSVLLWPHFPPTHDLVHDGWLHAVYFTLFVYGWAIGTHVPWWAEAVRLRRRSLAMALALLVAYLVLQPRWPSSGGRLALRILADFYLWAVLLAALGWAHRHLNRPFRWLGWANASVYPWYVLHQTVIIVLASGLAPWQARAWVEAPVLVAGTVAGCWMLTAIVRRSKLLRPLFGLPRRQAASAASTSFASDAGLSSGA